MRKIQILGLTLFAVFAFSAIAASVAFAESEFLVGGVAAKVGEPVHSEGELELIATKQTIFNITARVLCSGLIEGTFEGANDALLTKAFDLAGKELTELAGGVAVECVNLENCPTPLVFPDNLPWLAEIVLDSATELLLHLTEDGKGFPGWDVECMGNGFSNLCSGLVSGLTENLPGEKDFDVIFTRAEQEAANEGGTCTEGGPAYIAGTLLALEVNALEVSVS
jgi:hypothetical protein